MLREKERQIDIFKKNTKQATYNQIKLKRPAKQKKQISLDRQKIDSTNILQESEGKEIEIAGRQVMKSYDRRQKTQRNIER